MFEASRLGRLGEPLAREAAACSGRVRVKHLGSCRSRWRGKCGASAAARCELAADRRSRVSPPRRARPRHDDVRRWLANGRIIAGPDACGAGLVAIPAPRHRRILRSASVPRTAQ
jgi:hypothetical protein